MGYLSAQAYTTHLSRVLVGQLSRVTPVHDLLVLLPPSPCPSPSPIG